jgi:hypothetical protein
MDLLDGPDPDGYDDADMIEMDPPRRWWEGHTEEWQRRWRESRRLTRAVFASGAIVVLAAGAGIAYVVMRPATPGIAASSASTGTAATASQPVPGTQIQWLNGPRNQPWAEVQDGSLDTGIDTVQSGTVTLVSPASITIKNSPGGRLFTYSVNAATQVDFRGDAISAIHKGATVDVIATKTGKTTTALVIETVTGTGPGQRSPVRIVVDNPVTGKSAAGIMEP